MFSNVMEGTGLSKIKECSNDSHDDHDDNLTVDKQFDHLKLP